MSLIIAPIILFVIKFGSQSISNDITDWASFGSYISGIINTFIAIISLIVLSYLTYFVSRQSSSENKNVNMLMRKLDAYESLVSYVPILNSSMENMIWYIGKVIKYMTIPNSEKEYEENLEKIFEAVRNFKEFHFFLISFEDRYGHLFNYNFNSSDFTELAERAEETAEYYDKMLENLSVRKKEIPPDGEKKSAEFVTALTKFNSSLKNELDTK